MVGAIVLRDMVFCCCVEDCCVEGHSVGGYGIWAAVRGWYI